MIHRTRRPDRTFRVSWELAQARMDPDTLGVLIYLLSKPDDWKASTNDVEKHFGIGRDRRRRIFAEAERLGHITAERVKGPDGQWHGVTWYIWDDAVPEEQRTQMTDQKADRPETRGVGNQPVGKPTPLHEERLEQEERDNRKREKKEILGASPKTTSSDSMGITHPRAAVSDRRSNHPAIEAMRGVLSRYPNKEQWPMLIAALGDAPDVARLRRCYDEWVLHGWNALNLVWATEWYLKGPPNGFTVLTPEEEKKQRFWNSVV